MPLFLFHLPPLLCSALIFYDRVKKKEEKRGKEKNLVVFHT
jgi:hypothetical protein